MNSPNPWITLSRRWLLSQAAADFFHFQNRGYPRGSALEWTGNRYQLTHGERQWLHRGVFSQKDALQRRSKQGRGSDWQNELLFVDGHNVHITMESAILERPLLKGNDGALRDLAGESSRFRHTEVSELAMDILFRFLEEFRPRQVIFLFDAPMSHSGLLASAYRRRLKALRISGTSEAVAVPEREFRYAEGVVASSDGAVLDQASQWLDLARAALAKANLLQLAVDFSSLLLTQPAAPYALMDPDRFS